MTREEAEAYGCTRLKDKNISNKERDFIEAAIIAFNQVSYLSIKHQLPEVEVKITVTDKDENNFMNVKENNQRFSF